MERISEIFRNVQIGNRYFEWLAESLRSVLPRAVALGIVTESEVDIDTLEERLRAENAATNSSVPAPAMIGAFARLKG